MGREQRARGRAIAGTPCYLCGAPIDPDNQKWNRDHVPPRRVFASSIRRQFAPNLQSLPTHTSCNTAAERDEAYFIVSFVGHLDSEVAQEVMKDILAKAQKGEGVGLIQDVLSRFGQVMGPKGELLFSYDQQRVNNFLWKVTRGIYTLETGTVLPRRPPPGIVLANPRREPEELARLTWFHHVRDTEPMGRYGRVFDYKWISWRDGRIKGHAFAMVFWDRLLSALLFHDPRCECGQCAEWHRDAPSEEG